MKAPAPRRRLVLVGGGHAHVQVLRRLVMQPDPGVHLTLITDSPRATYSGMVPGLIAGQYMPSEVTIDLLPLARRAGAAVVLAPALRVDAPSKQVWVDGERPPVRYDVCSIDIGSRVAGDELPGVREFAVATRPIGLLEERLRAQLDMAGAGSSVCAVVVGAGAAGVELAFALRARLEARAVLPRVTVVSSADQPQVGGGRAGARRVRAAFERLGIDFHGGARVVEVRRGAVVLAGETLLPADLTVWAAGAAAHPLGADSGLPVDESGWIQTDPQLAVVGHPDLFAAGDCAVLAEGPRLPRAGVYAVRSGPVLADNLFARLRGQAGRPFRPQRSFLALLNTCDGGAIGTRGRWAGEGRWLGQLKDWIDRRFMEKFQVLDASGRPAAAFDAGMPPMGEEMACGGCAAKLADAPLRRALAELPPPPPDPDVIAGVDVGDDVAVLRHAGGTLVQTVDAFPAFTDDPWLVGRVAAINALNDVWAKGATPRFALAVVEVPEVHGASVLSDTLRGVRVELDKVGVSLVGGHTTVGAGLRVGLSITGVPTGGASLWPTSGGAVGDALVLSRAVGSGVVLHADMAGRATGSEVEALHRHLLESNARAAEVLRAFSVKAATDVTGFGLARHLLTLLASPRVAAELMLDRLPLLPGAERLLAAGERSTFHAQNRLEEPVFTVDRGWSLSPRVEALFDPQTAGGLLVALPADEAQEAVDGLRTHGFGDAVWLGQLVERKDGARVRGRASPVQA